MNKAMKKILCLILCVLACVGSAEEFESLDAEKIALDSDCLISAIVRCPQLTSFEDEVPYALAKAIELSYAELNPENPLTLEEIFACPISEESELALGNFVSRNYVIDSALDTGLGSVKISVSVYAFVDEGEEFEFAFDITVLPGETSASGVKILKIFFPD